MKGIIAFIAAAALAVLVPSQGVAQQGGRINFGNLSIVPGVELSTMYDDNIFKGSGQTFANPALTLAEKEESDLITHLKPSLFLNYSMQERGTMRLGYQGDFAFYDKNDGNDWKSHQLGGNINYQAPGGLLFGIDEAYIDSEDPYGSADQYNIGVTTSRWTNDFKTKVGYGLTSNYRGFLYYNNYKQEYDRPQDFAQNYTVNEFGFGVQSRFLPKTWGFFRYMYGIQEYETGSFLATTVTSSNSSDFKRHRASIGLTWDPDAKLSGEVSFGYETVNYDNDLTPTGTLRDDQNSWAAATAVTYIPTATTSLGLSLTRQIRNTSADSNENFIDTAIGVNLTQQLMDKLSLTAGATFGINDYNVGPGGIGVPREDDNYLFNLGVNYAIQEWLGVGGGYNYNKKDSNYDTNDFVDNQFVASVRVVY